jgi:hypothetical protein
VQDIKRDTRSPAFIPRVSASSLTSSPVSRSISLRRQQALANCRITHILSVIGWHFEDDSTLKGYKHLHILVNDVNDENLITWFPKANRFIDDGLNPPCQAGSEVAPESGQNTPDQNAGGSGVLVHW